MWSGLLASAAANKAASAAVGLSVILGGGAAIEAAGVGPTVREAVGVSQPGSDESGDGEQVVASLDLEENDAGSANGQGASVAHEVAPEGLSGNLVTQVRKDGSFQIRGVLEGAYDEGGEYSITVRVAGLEPATVEESTGEGDTGGEELTLEVGTVIMLELGEDTSFVAPGKPGDEELTLAEALDAYAGQLVIVQGSCEEGELGGEDSECYVDRVQILGGPAAIDGEEGTGVQGATQSANAAGGKPESTPPDHSNAGGDGDPESEGDE